MGTVLTLAGVAIAVVYAAWRLGAFPGAARRLSAATSPALLGAMPVFAAGFLAFGRAGTWEAAPLVGFLLLAAGIAVLAALVHGGLVFLVPAAALDVAPAATDEDDPRPALETFFSEADAFAYGPAPQPRPKPRGRVEPQPAVPRPAR